MSLAAMPPSAPAPRGGRFRLPGRILRHTGTVIVLGGCLATLWGSILPWLQFSLFNFPIVIPGLVGLGAATATLALLILSRPASRPFLGLAMGLGIIGIGLWAQNTLGRETAKRILALKMQFSPVNARLEEARLPPIEPFPGSIRAADLTGPGLRWTVYGGIALVCGTLVQAGAARWERTCSQCGTSWKQGRMIFFCPGCGAGVDTTLRCRQCHVPLERRDAFCPNCGANTGQRELPGRPKP